MSDKRMNWLQYRAQAKPMALPFDRPPDDFFSYQGYDRYPAGVDTIDRNMTPETADRLRQQHSPTYVGSGSAGTVIRLNNGHVGKLTDDYAEAKFAQWIKEHPHPRVITVYNVSQVQQQNTNPQTSTRVEPLWMIEMPMIQVLDAQEKQVADNFSVWSRLARGEKVTEWLTETYDNAVKVWPDMVPFLDELMSFGHEIGKTIECGDARGDNIGWLDGHLVLIDLGNSSVLKR